MSDHVLLGGKVRRLRRAHGVTQVDMARRLGISPSYLNLIEHNQRPLTRPLLVKLADSFGIDLQALSEDEDARIIANLDEVMGDAMFHDHKVDRSELSEAISAAPALGKAMLALYGAYRNAREGLDALSERLSDDALLAASTHELRTVLTTIRSLSEILHDYEDLDAPQRQRFLEVMVGETDRLVAAVDKMISYAKGEQFADLPGAATPGDDVMDFIQLHNNHFPQLETAAEALWTEAGLVAGQLESSLAKFLETAHGVTVKTVADEEFGADLVRFDPALQVLLLSDAISASRRTFEIARCIGKRSNQQLVEEHLAESPSYSTESQELVREAMAGYFAGAVILPYVPFAATARSLRYDIERLQEHFSASFEQICHRLTTLQRPNDRGVPFHFVRVDVAGNVSKRFSGSGLRIARYGGVCPRWNVHEAFTSPGRIQVQIAELPGGGRFLCVARTVTKPAGGYRQPQNVCAVAIGCDIAYAPDLVYADGLDWERPGATVPIGINCRLCERTDCRQRAFPALAPLNPSSTGLERDLSFDDH